MSASSVSGWQLIGKVRRYSDNRPCTFVSQFIHLAVASATAGVGTRRYLDKCHPGLVEFGRQKGERVRESGARVGTDPSTLFERVPRLWRATPQLRGGELIAEQSGYPVTFTRTKDTARISSSRLASRWTTSASTTSP